MPSKRKYILFLGVPVFTFLILAVWFFWDWRPVPKLLPDPTAFAAAPEPGPEASYDVVVIGGQPEGVAAAIAAAGYGANVLLVEKRDGLGGLFTYGWLNFIDMNHGPKYELLTRGSFLDFYRRVGGSIFDIETAKSALAAMVAPYPNLALSLNTTFQEPILEDNRLKGIKVIKDGREVNFYGRRFIDATQDAGVAAAAGVPYTIGAEDIGEKDRFQAVTLVFQLGDIDWQALGWAVKRGQIKDAKISAQAAWGFNSIAANYQPSTEQVRLRGFNIARQNDGTVLINALQIFGIDGLDEDSKAEAMRLAKAELPNITAFLQAQMPGFAQARLLGAAPELYIRETRHIKAFYQLDINDVVFNRYFQDAIALASYPVDVQATSPQDSGYVYGNPKVYTIPFRSLVPQKIDNLLVVGRSAGYTHLAAGSARVVPVGMVCGDAAGVSAVHSLKVGKNFHEMATNLEDIRAIQELFVRTGSYLKDYRLKNSLENHWAFTDLEFVNHWGLIVGGYDNDWGLKASIKRNRFYYMTANALQRALGRYDLVQEKAGALYSYLEAVDLTRAEAARLLLVYLEEDVNGLEGSVLINKAAAKGLFALEQTGSDPQAVITGAEAYYATARLCELLPKTKTEEDKDFRDEYPGNEEHQAEKSLDEEILEGDLLDRDPRDGEFQDRESQDGEPEDESPQI